MNPKDLMNENCCSSPEPLTLDAAAANLAVAKRRLNDAEGEFEACAFHFNQAYARRDRAKFAYDEARRALLTITKG